MNYVAVNPASGMWSCAQLRWVTVLVAFSLEGDLTNTVYKQFQNPAPWQIIFACWSDSVRMLWNPSKLRWRVRSHVERGGEEVVHLSHWCCIQCKNLQLGSPGRQMLTVVVVFHASKASAGDRSVVRREGCSLNLWVLLALLRSVSCVVIKMAINSIFDPPSGMSLHVLSCDLAKFSLLPGCSFDA